MALPETARRKVDRDEVFLEYTKSICPVCKRVLDAEVNVRENRVILRKRCPEHGSFEALVYSDAQLYIAQQRYNKPGKLPLALQTEVKDGCRSTAVCAPSTSSTPRGVPKFGVLAEKSPICR